MIQYEGNDKYTVHLEDKVLILSSDEIEQIASESFAIKALKEEVDRLKAKNEMLMGDIEYIEQKCSGSRFNRATLE